MCPDQENLQSLETAAEHTLLWLQWTLGVSDQWSRGTWDWEEFLGLQKAWVQESLLPCTLQQLIPSSCHDENKAVTWKLTTHQHCDFAKLKGYQFKFFLLVSNICMVNFVILCVVTCDLTLLFEFWYSNYLGYLSTQKFSISIRSICVFCKLSEINLTHLLFILYR